MPSEKNINILMTGGGAPGAAGILKCLQFNPVFEITMADANPNAISRWLHAEFETIPFAQHKKEFEKAGIKVLVSDLDAVEIANNKSRLYQFLEWRGIDVPAYRVVETIEQFKTAAEELGFPDKRICFKPSVSNGSRGFRIIAEDIDEHDLLFNEKPNS